MKTVRFTLGLAMLLWLLPLGGALGAETYPITGTVTLADGRPVEGVAIYVDGSQAARSDQAGQFMAPAVPAGTHLVQPVKQGMIFIPAEMQVTLPPAAGISFTGYEATGGTDSTSWLLPASQELSVWQQAAHFAGQWLRVVQQLVILMLVLSAGAVLALAARRLRGGVWSLGGLPQGQGRVQPQAAPAAGVEEPFEVVAAAQAVEINEEEDLQAQWAVGAEEEATLAPPAPPAAEISHTEPTMGKPQRKPPRIAVRRYSRLAPALPVEPLPRAVAFLQRGDLPAAEALLRQVLQAQPGSAEAWYWLGEVRLRQGDRRTAERCFAQARRLG